MTPKPTLSRIAGLDGLRALAATLVFVFHAYGHAGFPPLLLNLPGGLTLNFVLPVLFGSQGVALFFVLSGFLLSQPFWQALIQKTNSVDTRRYLWRRFARIYPAYAVAVLVYAFLHDTAHPVWVRLVQIATHLLLVHNFSEVTVYNPSVPLWSVATESQLYLVLPLIFIGLGWLAARDTRPVWLTALVVIGGGLLSALFYAGAIISLPHLALDPRLVSVDGNVLAASPLVGLAHFAAGVGAGYLYLRWRSAPQTGTASGLAVAGWGLLALLVLASFLDFRLLGFPPTGWPTVSLLFAGLVLWVTLSSTPFTAWLELWPLRFIGTISYSLYLYHDFVLYNVYNRLPLAWAGSLLDSGFSKGLLAYALTLILAWLSYRFIEKPVGQWLNALVDRPARQVLESNQVL